MQLKSQMGYGEKGKCNSRKLLEPKPNWHGIPSKKTWLCTTQSRAWEKWAVHLTQSGPGPAKGAGFVVLLKEKRALRIEMHAMVWKPRIFKWGKL